jgi:hypothetical protein
MGRPTSISNPMAFAHLEFSLDGRRLSMQNIWISCGQGRSRKHFTKSETHEGAQLQLYTTCFGSHLLAVHPHERLHWLSTGLSHSITDLGAIVDPGDLLSASAFGTVLVQTIICPNQDQHEVRADFSREPRPRTFAVLVPQQSFWVACIVMASPTAVLYEVGVAHTDWFALDINLQLRSSIFDLQFSMLNAFGFTVIASNGEY